MNQAQSFHPGGKPQALRPWLMVVLIIVIIAAAAYWYFTHNQTNASPAAPGPTPTATAKPSASPSATPTAAGFTYTDNTYEFSFTYPANWGNCKVKPVDVAGTEKTYYINCPTADKSFAAGDSLQYPGYFAPLAISVYTPAEWTNNQQTETEKDSLITQNNTYMFGWLQSNGQLPSDWTEAMWNNHDPLINSFKLN